MMNSQQDQGDRPVIYEPKIVHRDEQPYMGIRTRVTMEQLGSAIPRGLDEIAGWLDQQGIAPASAPFIRYHVINMQGMMDIELGIPIASAAQAALEPGYDRVQAGMLPAGSYAALVYTDIDQGIRANAALLDWGARNGLVWDQWDVEEGDAFGSRYESFLTDPDVQPDMSKWETEVAIRLSDSSPG